MARQLLHSFLALAVLSSVQAYFLVGNRNILVTERLDPIINPGAISGHSHSIVGGSNFGSTLSTASLRNSECTTMPIQEDKSNYWFPHLYFQHKNGSFSSLTVGNVIYYLFNDAQNGQPNTVKAFPDDFRMISGDMTLRSYNASSYAQQAVTFLCLDFNGVSTKYNELPPISCPSGIRAQINFPMCWDGKNLDSADHKSHVAFPSGGPDSGTCNDPKFPVTLPRIFIEGYWATGDFDKIRDTDAMNSTQPYVFSHGDPTGYGYHADFFNGWKSGVLQNVLDKCACTSAGFGDATCCGDSGVFTLQTSGSCGLTPIVDEQVLGTLPALPGNNPVRYGPAAAPALAASSVPAILSPAYAYTGGTATATGTVVSAASSAAGAGSATGAPANPTSASSVQTPASASTASAVVTAGSNSASASGTTAASSASASTVSASSHSSQASVSVTSSQAGQTSPVIPPPAHGASAASASTSGNAAVAVPTSASGSNNAASSNVAVASPASASGSGHDCASSSAEGASATLIVSESAMPASASPASVSATVIPASAFPSVSAIGSSAGYTILPASAFPASSTASASGASSSSSSSSDDDDEYEYYCERRPKRKNHHHNKRSSNSSSSKVRKNLHHNVHRRLSDNDF